MKSRRECQRELGVLDLFQVADGSILALKNFCSGGNSHHGAIALGDANFWDFLGTVVIFLLLHKNPLKVRYCGISFVVTKSIPKSHIITR